MPELIETFTRPNGKPYKPRSPKLVAHAWENYDDCRSGVIILGTLNPERAHDFAFRCAGIGMAANSPSTPNRAGFETASTKAIGHGSTIPCVGVRACNSQQRTTDADPVYEA